ncbi:cytochrome P450 [Nocardia thailandica]
MTRSAPARRAHRYELAVHAAAQPGLAALLAAGHRAAPLRRLPLLGWVIADPLLAREVHRDSEHYSIVADGASGHWWAQMLGDFVYRRFEGPDHLEFRAKVNHLFTRPRSEAVVSTATSGLLDELAVALAAGRTVDIGEFSRLYTTRTVLELCGLPEPASNERVLDLFRDVERLADLGKGSWATTTLPPRKIRRGHALAERIAADVDRVLDTASEQTTIGRCRALGLPPEEVRGLTVLLVVAGTATLAGAMGRLIALLHDTGDQHTLLADPRRIPDAVREGLRVTSSMPVVGRGVVRDVELGGRRLRRGDRVKILTWSIDNAGGGFDLNRAADPELRQLWFGGGRHLCLGAALTHVEITRFLETMLAAGRPWRVVRRRYRVNAFVPMYQRLDIRL